MSGSNDEPPEDGDDEDVGYGKPPKRTRFKPGQSGNPKGRPKRAKGKHQLLVDAIDQPTRQLFMEEMNRPVKINDGVRKVSMPAKQMIMRSMVRSAAQGGQQAQRTALMLQLEIERQVAEENAKGLAAFRDYKALATASLARQRREGLPEPDLVPHPDDIFIDELKQQVEVRGPFTPEQKAQFDKVIALRDGYQRGVSGLQAEAKSKPRDWTLPMWAVMAQMHFDSVNSQLPERYRKKLEDRMSEAQIDAAREKARRGAAASERRKSRGRSGDPESEQPG